MSRHYQPRWQLSQGWHDQAQCPRVLGLVRRQATPMFAQLQTMLVRSPPSRRAFGAMRGPACPTLAELKDLDAIVAADQIPACQVISRQALEAYVAADSAGAPAEPAKP